MLRLYYPNLHRKNQSLWKNTLLDFLNYVREITLKTLKRTYRGKYKLKEEEEVKRHRLKNENLSISGNERCFTSLAYTITQNSNPQESSTVSLNTQHFNFMSDSLV